jgi:hypothetical protein
MSEMSNMTPEIEEKLERYLSGEMPAEERAEFEDAVLADPALALHLYSDVSVRQAIEEAARTRRLRHANAERDRARQRWRARLRWWATPVAAAVVIAAVAVGIGVFDVFNDRESEAPAVFRGTSEGPAAVSPRGEVPTPPTIFTWRSQPGAVQYRFELFDAQSRPLFATVTADTSVTVDTASVSVPDHGYWNVTPLDGALTPTGAGTVTWFQVVP